MRTAVALWNVVGKAVNVFLVAIIPLHRHFNTDAVRAFRLWNIEMEYIVQCGFVGVDVFNKRTQTTFVLENIFFAIALVFQNNTHARVQKTQFAQAFGKNVVTEMDIGKRLWRRPELDFRAAPVGVTYFAQRVLRHTVLIFLLVQFAVAADIHLQFGGQSVYNRYTHAVQTAGHLVGVVIELTASMQHGHDNFGGGYTLFFMDIHRDTAAVIRDGNRFIRVDGHSHFGTVTSQRLIDAVVDYLEHHMVQAAAVIGVADVHTRTLAYRIQAFEHLDTG